MRKKVFVLMLAAVMVIASMLTSAALAESAEPAKIDLTGLINAAIAVLGLLITHRLVPWLKARTTSEQQQILAAGIRTAVYAAEQLYQTGVISDRLDYALKWLGSHGYSVARAQVEAAVHEMQLGQFDFHALKTDAEETEGMNNE